ncbi:MAG: carboxypeptidase regulatory-like domain-containing protein [Deltaproteobacteria bacterium]|nr:carboxypeptidase regulatory-like domain-containing protein [Deltaproteobacteria bacterium]
MRVVPFILTLGLTSLTLSGCDKQEEEVITTGSILGTVTLADGASPAGTVLSGAGQTTVADAAGAFTFSDVEAGVYTITASLDGYLTDEVEVDLPAMGAVTADLTLVPVNHAPSITALSVAPSELAPGGVAAVLATAEDLDGDSLSFAWSVDGGFTLIEGSTLGAATLLAPDEEDAAATLTLVVSDPDGEEATASVTVTTGSLENRPPVLSSLSLAPASLDPGDQAEVLAVASDPDGDPLSFAWTASGGFTLVEGATPGTATVIAPDAAGATGRLDLVVSDPDGAQTAGSLLLSTSTPLNASPVISSLSASPPVVRRGGEIALSTDATDPDSDPLTYTWTAPEGWTLTGQGADVLLTAPDLAGAIGQVALVVEDPYGGMAGGHITVMTSPNQAPSIASLSAAPNPVSPGGEVSLFLSANDPDGDPLDVTWRIDDPAWSLVPAGDRATVTAPLTLSASTQIWVDVTDGDGATTTAAALLLTAGTCPGNTVREGDTCAPCGSDAVAALGPVALWRLNETSGGVAVDEVGGHDALIRDAVVLGVPSPVQDGGTAAMFTADAQSRITLANFSDFPTDELSVLFWVRSNGQYAGLTAQNATPFSYGVTGSFNEVLLYNLDAYNPYLNEASSGTTAALADGLWHHLATTWRASDGELQVYVDGELVWYGHKQAGAPLQAGGTLVLGQEQDSLDGGFDASQALMGGLDDVAIFDRVLNAEEVARVARVGSCEEVCDGRDNDGDGRVDEGSQGTGSACPLASCEELLDEGQELSDVYWLSGATGPYETWCDQDTAGGGWTLVGSFVNDGVISWTRDGAGRGLEGWLTDEAFGAVRTRTTADFMSPGLYELRATDLMVSDASGYAAYAGVLPPLTTVRTAVARTTTCQVTPLVEPGDPRVEASSAIVTDGAMLTFMAGDPNNANQCPRSGVSKHSDSAVLALGGMSSGVIGLGQWGTNYTGTTKGLDWHLNLDEATLCLTDDPACVDATWYTYPTMTSVDHANNAGVHDGSRWGLLFAR